MVRTLKLNDNSSTLSLCSSHRCSFIQTATRTILILFGILNLRNSSRINIPHHPSFQHNRHDVFDLISNFGCRILQIRRIRVSYCGAERPHVSFAQRSSSLPFKFRTSSITQKPQLHIDNLRFCATQRAC